MSDSPIGWLKNFLFGDERPGPGMATNRPRAAGSQPPQGKPHPATSPLPASMQAGTLQMVGLQSLREILGPKWESRRDSIHRTTEGVIRRRIEKADAYYRVADDQFLVLFVHLRRQQAEAKAKAIADEIRQLIAGDLPPDCNIDVTSSVAEVNRDFLMTKVQSLDELLHYVRTGSIPAAEAESVTFFDAVDESGPEIAQPSTAVTGSGPDFADLDQSLAGLFQKKSSAAFLKECKAAFHPSFSLKRRSFSFYHVGVTHLPTGLPAHDVDDPLLDDPEELRFLLDRYILTTALLGLHQMVSGGGQGIISIPVSFATLTSAKHRNIYLSRLKEIPSGLAKYLSASLGNIPEGTPAIRVADALAYIQPFCASRILAIPPDIRLMDQYAASGCHGFETRLPPDIAGPEKRYQLLFNFVKRATWHKVESILTGVSTRDDLHAAVTSGLSFASGGAIAAPVNVPGWGKSLSAEHIPARGDTTITVFPGEGGYTTV